MLFGLIMSYAMDGVDAFEPASKVVPTIDKGDDKQVQAFKFKQQVLVILLDKGNQRLLRSYLCVFKKLRQHQTSFTKIGTDPAACLRFHMMWSHPTMWLIAMVIPSMIDGLCSLDTMERLMFNSSTIKTTAPASPTTGSRLR